MSIELVFYIGFIVVVIAAFYLFVFHLLIEWEWRRTINRLEELLKKSEEDSA